MSKKFENATLCLWSGLTLKLISQENIAFRKQSSKPEEFEDTGFAF